MGEILPSIRVIALYTMVYGIYYLPSTIRAQCFIPRPCRLVCIFFQPLWSRRIRGTGGAGGVRGRQRYEKTTSKWQRLLYVKPVGYLGFLLKTIVGTWSVCSTLQFRATGTAEHVIEAWREPRCHLNAINNRGRSLVAFVLLTVPKRFLVGG